MIAVGVVSHPQRDLAASRLAERVGAEVMAVDAGGIGPGRNHDRAWEWLADSGQKWSVLLEDDALPVPGFGGQLRAALAVAPSPLVSLYLGRSRPRHWQPSIMRVVNCSEHWLQSEALLHHVGVAIQTDLIEDMLSFRKYEFPVDEETTLWAQERHIRISYCLPSIVDHDDVAATLIRNRTSMWDGETGVRDDRRETRRAWFVGERAVWKSTCRNIPPPRF